MSKTAEQAVDSEIADPRWKGLYIVGAAAAVIAVLFFRRNFGTEVVAFRGFGIYDVPAAHPSNAAGWFTLLQDDKFLGLVLFDVVNLVNYALVGLIFLALYGALRRDNKGVMVIATVLGFVGIAVYLISNQAFAMLSLSDQYAAATTDAQRSTFLDAGEALLAIHNPGTIQQGTGIYLSLFLVLLAGLIVSVVMLQSNVFGKATAWVGVVTNGIGLLHFVALAFVPALLAFPTSISAPFRVTWYILIAIGLFRLGSGKSKQGAIRNDR